jgi:hypothetical protein
MEEIIMTTKLTATNIKHLNRMNNAASAVALGTWMAGIESASATLTAGAVVMSGSTVSNAQAAASALTIKTGLATVTYFMVQQTRSGSPLATINLFITTPSGSITISGSGAGVITTGDKFSIMAK